MWNEQYLPIWNRSIGLAAGAVLGLGIALGACGFLVWNEGKSISTAISLEQGAANVRSVSATSIDPANDGKLVYLTGDATTNETLTDPELGISAQALRLTRDVELYQWKEKKTESKNGGKTVVTYKYTLVWSKDKPNKVFVEPVGHVNPDKFPLGEARFKAAEVNVGAFTLSPDQIEKIPADDSLLVTPNLLDSVPIERRDKAQVDGEGRLYIGFFPGSNPNNPQAGDVRIRYKVAMPQPVSLVARQKQNSFEPYVPEGGEPIDLLKAGSHPVQTMFEAAHGSRQIVGWIMRVIGFVFMALALYLMLRRQVCLTSGVLPNRRFESSVAVLAIVAAIPIVMIVVGVRWLLHQPVFGGGALVAGALVLGGLTLLIRSNKSGLFAGLLGGKKMWSPEDCDYFRRIALDPENVPLRLEFATTLKKKREPLGHLIDLEEKLATMPPVDLRRKELEEKTFQLRLSNGARWYQPLWRLGLLPSGLDFLSLPDWTRRGIIDKVDLQRSGILPEKAAELFAAVPGLRELAFSTWDKRPDFAAIAQLPQLVQIGVLDLGGIELTLEELAALMASPYLENVTELHVRVFTDKDMAAVQKAEATGEPRRPVLKPEIAKLVASAASIHNLRFLNLNGWNCIGMDGAVALADSAKMAQLKLLKLSYNYIGPRGMSALAAAPHLTNLETLELSTNALGPVGMTALATSPHIRKLRLLELTSNAIGQEGAMALAKSANMANLTTLHLGNNQIGSLGLRYLAASPHLARLEVLSVDSNGIDDSGLEALSQNKVIQFLQELTLSANPIGDGGFKALANWPGLVRVKRLFLTDTKITAAGVQALAASPFLKGLEELYLSSNNVGLEGARALANSTMLTSLETLWIQDAQLTEQGQILLHQRFGKDLLFM